MSVRVLVFMGTRIVFFRRSGIRAAAALALSAALLACDDIQRIGEKARPATPHERYANSLQEAGLDRSALGRAWIAAARHAVAVPISITLPYSEVMYFPAGEPRASAFRAVVRRGQRLVVSVESAPGSGARVFVDVFTMGADATLRSVESALADSGRIALSRETDIDSTFVVRVQPELLESARVTLTVRVEPTLAFPLPNASNRSVQSFWGASRDGGRRQHQGVDIFAPRGTPVLAVAPGVVSHVGTSRLGGNVVWLRDSKRGQNIYYAHLDRQLVQNGQMVDPGDTLGTVGTTGNARGGAPHLHFGIYRRGFGAIDPYHFIRREDDQVRPLRADTSLFGQRARVSVASTDVRVAPGAKATSTATLQRNAPLYLEGASGEWIRVRVEDGITGYILGRAAEPASEPIRTMTLRAGDVIRERPDTIAMVIDSASVGTELRVLGGLGGFLLVQNDSGGTGWIAARQLVPAILKRTR